MNKKKSKRTDCTFGTLTASSAGGGGAASDNERDRPVIVDGVVVVATFALPGDNDRDVKRDGEIERDANEAPSSIENAIFRFTKDVFKKIVNKQNRSIQKKNLQEFVLNFYYAVYSKNIYDEIFF